MGDQLYPAGTPRAPRDGRQDGEMPHSRVALAGFLVGAAGMFAVMYSTQAILPELAREFDVSAAQAGLTVSVVIVVLAAGAWIWGPLSDRWGRKRSLVLASALVSVPTLASAFAPSFELLLVCRALQGLCMPGLLTVGAPYVVEVFGPVLGGRAMGMYILALVCGGIVGRVGIALATALFGWRWPIAALALLPAAGAVLMARTLPEAPRHESTARRWDAVRRLARNRALQQATAAGSAMFFAFVGVFSFVTFRVEDPPFSWGQATASLIFLAWGFGLLGPAAGALADRTGWRPVVVAALATSAVAVALSLPSSTVTLPAALCLMAAAMFCGVTAAQIGSATSTTADRGVASAMYFSAYYASGALGGYLPGLAWEQWRWGGVVASCLGVLAAALLFVATRSAWRACRRGRTSRMTGWVRRRS
jgi:YNFM family putative membrane transporter